MTHFKWLPYNSQILEGAKIEAKNILECQAMKRVKWRIKVEYFYH